MGYLPNLNCFNKVFIVVSCKSLSLRIHTPCWFSKPSRVKTHNNHCFVFLFLVGFATWYGYWYVFDYVDVLWCGVDCFVSCLFLFLFFFLLFHVMMYLLLLSLLLFLHLFLFFLFLMFLLVNFVLVPGWCWSFGSTVSLLSLPHVKQQEWQNINISNGNKILFCVSKAKIEPKNANHKTQEPKVAKTNDRSRKSRKTRPHQNQKRCKKSK